MIEIFSLMNKIVCYRVQVLRSAEESDLQGKESSQEKIQQLLEIIENGEILSGSLWNMKMEGKARRVQRGTLVSDKVDLIVFGLRDLLINTFF